MTVAAPPPRRPAAPPAAYRAFAEHTRVADDQCDAWTGLAAAGGTDVAVLAAVVRTVETRGVLQRHIELPAGALGFDYDTGLYLRFRATGPDDFRLAHAAALGIDGDFATADEIVTELRSRRPQWLAARWVAAVLHTRAARWADVVKLLTPVVNDPGLDPLFAHAAKVALGVALARLGMFAPALAHPAGRADRRGPGRTRR